GGGGSMSTAEPAPDPTNPSTSGLAPTTNGIGSPPPTASAATKFSILTKFLRRKNQVHTTTAQQNEFMQKYMPNGNSNAVQPAATGGQPASSDGGSAIEVPPPKESYAVRIRKYLANYTQDPSTDNFYYWTCVVTVAYIYNLLFVIARQVFNDLIGPSSQSLCRFYNGTLNSTTQVECTYNMLTNMKEMPTYSQYPDLGWSKYWHFRMLWVFFDLLMDCVYLIDTFLNYRMGYMDQGLVVREAEKVTKAYWQSKQYRIDGISLIPLDYILGWPIPYINWRGLPILRLNRLIRYKRVRNCLERTETRSSMPNAFRVVVVVWYIVIIIHWNACLYFWISEWIGLGTDAWVYGHLNKQSLPDDITDTLLRRYVYSFYWSTLILTTIGEVPSPVRNIEYAFVTLDLMCGVLIFATIVGNVGSMISNMSAAWTEFQNKMDGIKQYMELRKVSKQLEIRVIKWFDYLWTNKQSLSDQQVLKVLPDKLQAEIAMQVHFETLRKVRIFQDCEAGLLAELVLKLQLQVFSPGDFICKKGDIGREMYIVKRGRLQVVDDDGKKVFVTLQEGSVFGELSILNIAGSKNGNRRTANVRSVGYTDLFVLSKTDLWNALREYPDARKLLLAKGREILKKDNLLDENAPEEQKTVEEIAEHLNNAVKVLQTRMARLIVEHSSTEGKLMKRIEMLEKHLSRYKALARRQKTMHGVSIDGGDISTDGVDERVRPPRLRQTKTIDLPTGTESESLLK
uniref:Cyclic nucleotide-gated cation channel n=1 Tax=Caenorhabditis elegans TaxID=6239 RepID=UPI001F4A0AE9|nr:Chain A, Cyclic nucleotide-gated cation channel [Caenorhabditis elegans]7N15_B Chain B, Cyclic nucleotide-gated cation channel [Caenorhabditis elegans]7N15_C Chain C, Cyclic nucleotide-gated cation channel [Caenorhabditis elegans]7N15_D Chain D, Cyclic nucleotide-gated cation channel [Caenorhabditis elegans]7N16_A Chain A, Cyclic nucleotide-gated cation channel [Caenorhabditis elegans]7N16_B Chain B, Cyclic nucleotide-gated cation channel [Caenorhabditis elegans]7N16_C Chain C, Cyclic nucl